MPKNTKAKQQKPKVKNIRAKLVKGRIDVSWTLSKKCKAEYKYQVFCDGQKFGEEIWTTETHFQYDPQNGSDYYFEVGICNGNGDHKKIRSNAVHIHHLNLRNVNVCKDDKLENVHITWDKLEKPNVKYHIKACRDDGTVVIKDTTKQNECQLQGFQRSQNYTFSITANFSGEDGPSFVSEKIRFSPAKLNAKTRVTNKGIVVSWTGVEHVQLRYFVAVDCDDEPIVRCREVTETRYCFLNPKPSKKYSFEVWAKDGDMEGQHVRVHHATAPVAIGEIKAIQKDQSILVSWRKMDEDGVKYFVQTFCDGKKVGEPCLSPNDNPQFDFIPTKHLAKYSFQVWAQNTLGVDGKKSTSKDIMMTPRRLRSITAIETDEGIVVTWDKSDDGDVHYVVQALCDDKKCGKQVTSDASFVYCKPQPATKYRFQVWVQHAGGIDGEKAESNTIITRAPQLKNVKATYSFGKIKITWQNGVVDGAIYHLKIYGDGLDCGTHSMTDCIYQHDPLKNIKSYRYEIWCEIRGVHGKPCTLEAPSVCLMQIEGITVTKDNAGIHVSWQDECDTGNTYQVQVLCNGEKSGGIHKMTEARFLLKDPSHSVKYQFQIWPESPGGIVGGKICSEIIEIPAPLKSVFTKRNGNSITVAWRGSESSGLKHMIQVYCDGKEDGAAQLSDANQFHFSAAEYGRKYHFVVWAETDHNIRGKPVRSDSVIMPPAKLQCVEAHQQGNNIRVTWEKCTRSNVKYRVQVNCNGQKLGPTRNPSTNEFLFTESEHSKKYSFTVCARTAGGAVGETADSNSVAMPPSPIDGLDVRIHGQGISVSWEPLNSLVIYNVLTYCNEEEVQPLYETKETHFFLKYPEPSKKYSFKVWATANGKNGEPVLSSSLLVPSASLKNAKVSSDGESLILSWDRRDENDAIYHVQAFCDDQVCRPLHTTTENYFRLQSTQFSKKYDFEVWSESHGMEGSKSRISVLMHLGNIQELQARRSENNIVVSWKDQETEQLCYMIQVIRNDMEEGSVETTLAHSFQLPSLKYSSKYEFVIWAKNQEGAEGPRITTNSVITEPAQLQNLEASRKGDAFIISWQKHADDSNDKMNYHVQVRENGRSLEPIQNTSECSFTYKPPDVMAMYRFVVRARNSYGIKGKKSKSNRIRMCIEAGNGVYFDKSKPLREDYGVYEGYLVGATLGKEKIAVKIICSVQDPERLAREVNHMQEVSQHPNTVTYRLSGKFAHFNIYIAMELCCRETLYEMVKLNDLNDSHGEAEGIDFVTVLLHVTHGLRHIDEKKILHRDLKPQNVLCSLDGKNMKIADFGLSKKMHPEKSTVSKSRREIGTDGWGSPENYSGKKMHGKSDIFSAGLLFYFTLSGGKHAFGTDPCRWKINIIDQKAPDLSGLTCPYPEIAANLILKMLKQEPDERPSAKDVLKHPFFWSNRNRIDFICEMKKFMEPYQSDSVDQRKNDQNVDKMIADLKKNAIHIIGDQGESNATFNWAEKLKTRSTTDDNGANDGMEPETHDAVYSKATEIVRKKKQKYKFDCIFELLRFIRNLCEHYQEEDLDGIFQNRGDIWDYIYKRFPKLFCLLYDAACKYRDSSPDSKLSGDVEELFTKPASYRPLI